VKLLFTSTHRATFIEDDLILLGKHFDVEYLQTAGPVSVGQIAAAVRRNDVTFTWFASVYAAAVVWCARRWKKRSIVAVGGVDVANHPEIGYGIWRSPWKARLVRYALRLADRVCVVDPSLRTKAMTLAHYDGANIRYVPPGFDPEHWRPSGAKENFVLTVAKCEDHVRVRVKGLPFLLEAARRLPGVRFVIIGPAAHLLGELRAQAPSNVEILPLLPRHELLPYYRRAAVYCQPSYSEGLPNSLCEAMLCECVPVGTNVGGIPTAIDECGFLAPYGEHDALADAIGRALQQSSTLGSRSRARIAANFTLERRERNLLQLIGELVP
jgi:glycosyltransferase involved in cell wall biosynthesis